MSSLLSCSGDVRLGALNALSANRRPRRKTCGLRINEGSRMISGIGKVFLGRRQYQLRYRSMRGPYAKAEKIKS